MGESFVRHIASLTAEERAQLLLRLSEPNSEQRKEPNEPKEGEVIPLSAPQLRCLAVYSLEELNEFCISRVIPLPAAQEHAALRDAFYAEAALHDAFNLRLLRVGGGWTQRIASKSESARFQYHEISAYKASEQEEIIIEEVDRLQSGLDLEKGPLLQATLFKLGVELPSVMIITSHHFSADGYSLSLIVKRILRRLHNRQQERHTSALATYRDWVRAISAYTQSDELRAELPYWVDQLHKLDNNYVAPLALSEISKSMPQVSPVSVKATLSELQTKRLSDRVKAHLGMGIRNVLVTALAQMLCERSSVASLPLGFVGHGRFSPSKEMAISQICGFFSVHYPVYLDYSETNSPLAALERTKLLLGAVPNGGIGYDLLRYAAPFLGIATPLEHMHFPPVTLNFTNYTRHSVDESVPNKINFDRVRSTFRSGLEWKGQSPTLTCNASLGNNLSLSVQYRADCFQRQTVATFANEVLEAAITLVDKL